MTGSAHLVLEGMNSSSDARKTCAVLLPRGKPQSSEPSMSGLMSGKKIRDQKKSWPQKETAHSQVPTCQTATGAGQDLGEIDNPSARDPKKEDAHIICSAITQCPK